MIIIAISIELFHNIVQTDSGFEPAYYPMSIGSHFPEEEELKAAES
jgi:hypothetical protein